ncbi:MULTISPECIES: DUF6286 domain-containing protein [Streptomyces]|uniref:DUF6286 domain-containing protein n=1 Tax=Streptomyces TaxID=1883 RepID=UPI0006AF56E2|nr:MULTISPECIES: DUF6286 domain-containing protein [unclassified Streptomyces]MCI4080806.1 DUF6286 domain-containing protein [Streptomyces sp. MMS21 TC-5]QNE27959.1 hypothetical protein F1D59_27045 [Streptomyces sp. INR7]GLV95197.1 hypothetical protein Slala04_66500 [Streptomyces lavendulae subsp. lavendulae]
MTPRRFRSARRIPAALVALLVLGVAGLFLYDLAAVRADRPAMAWRRELAHRLEVHTPADLGVQLAGGVLVLAGVVLLLLAFTPGIRRILMMRSPDQDADHDADRDADGDAGRDGDQDAAGAARPPLRAGIGRKDAAQVLRDRAMEVPGVRSARVRMGRSRVRVRATSHFRELDEVRADLDAVIAVGIEELGLVHPPRPRLRVRRRAD